MCSRSPRDSSDSLEAFPCCVSPTNVADRELLHTTRAGHFKIAPELVFVPDDLLLHDQGPLVMQLERQRRVVSCVLEVGFVATHSESSWKCAHTGALRITNSRNIVRIAAQVYDLATGIAVTDELN